VVRDSEGDILLSAVSQGTGFLGPELEEARACIFAIRTAQQHGLRHVILEGDSLSLISKLEKKQRLAADIGLLVDEILNLSHNFNFCAFNFVRRDGNKVAHALAHLKPYVSSSRVWLQDGPDCVFDLALDDLCSCLEVT